MPVPALTKSGQQIQAALPTLQNRSLPVQKPQPSRYSPVRKPPLARAKPVIASLSGLPHPGPLGLITLRFNWAVEQAVRAGHPMGAAMQTRPWDYSLADALQTLQ
jgi:hypothetical protein